VVAGAQDDKPRVLARGSPRELRVIAEILREETVGGLLLLLAAVVALVWANSPWSASYTHLVSYRFGPSALHLDLTTAEWAADGLLAVFFFVAGLEVKREFLAGDLRDPRRAALPVVAAVGGVILPALIFLVVNAGHGDATRGWAVPTATDIAFVLAVLAVIGSALPVAMRIFLLTLAVVDDLIAIAIIAVFYTSDLSALPLLLALVPLALFGFAVQRGADTVWFLLPLAIITWALVHASGIHATVAGVLLAFTVPVKPGRHHDSRDVTELVPVGLGRHHDAGNLAEHMEHAVRPISAGVAVPIFALLSAGVALGGLSGLHATLTDHVALGIIVALIVGKTIGVFGAAWCVVRFTGAHLDPAVSWTDILGLALLCGVGFTVSLLIGELAFGAGSLHDDHVKVGVLAGSLLAAVIGGTVLRLRNRRYARLDRGESA
jgi:NhaA family Na+:H+ antiporter